MNKITTSSKNKTGRNYFLPAIIGIVLIIIILLLVIFFPCPTSSQYIVFRIVLSIALAALASIIPGFLKFQYQTIITAGGAIAIFAFTYIFNPALIDTNSKCNEPFDFTFFLEDSSGINAIKNSGKLILLIENDKREENIDAKGSTNFKQLPDKFKNQIVSIQLEVDGWEFQNNKTAMDIKLEGSSMRLIIKRDKSLCCVAGSVRDQKNNFIEGVKVSIADIYTVTNENGRFTITIPPEKQRDEQNLTAYKKGFKIWEDKVFPATKQEVSIILIHQ